MSERDLMTLAMVAGAFVIFGLPIIYLIRHSMKKNRVWRDFSERNNLKLEPGRFPRASGTIDGREISFSHDVGRTAGGRADVKRVAEFYAWAEIKGNVPEGFVAGKKGWVEGSGNLSGNELFSKKIRAECPDVEAGNAYLTPERQEVLLELIKFDGHAHGPQGETGSYVVINRAGYKVKDQWFEDRRNILLKAAKVLDN